MHQERQAELTSSTAILDVVVGGLPEQTHLPKRILATTKIALAGKSRIAVTGFMSATEMAQPAFSVKLRAPPWFNSCWSWLTC